MVKQVRSLFIPPSMRKVYEKELYAAQRELATEQTRLEYAIAMVAYNKARVARLQQALMEEQNVAP